MSQSGWIGKSLHGRYVVEEMLGQGGMSAVYKATDPNLKRVVAIKMIHPHLSDNPDFVRRFEEEATAVAQLRHPGIIQVYDFNQEDGVYYMVLEFVPGETVQDHLRRLNAAGRRLSITKAIEYVINICDAVDYAHQRGLIHRDIKPANIMLNLLGEAILMDFGIAKILGGQQHTSTGAVVGTAMYMSPEQIKGERADRRTDIYSLGVTMFEMVSGHPPFEADSAMTLMMMHVNDPVPNLHDLNPEVPDDLVLVINKALEKNPDDRYQTGAQMGAALRKVLGRIKSGSFVEAPAPGATMLEEAPKLMTSPKATVPPPVAPEGTMVESAPRASMATPGGGGSLGGMAMESSAVKPVPAPKAPAADAPPRKLPLSMPVIVGIFVGLACLIFGGLFLVNQLLNRGANPAPPTEEPVGVVLDITETLAPTALVPESTATLEGTSTPSVTPTITNTPEPTVPPGIPFVRINAITVDEQNRYVVDYETFEYTEVLPGQHVHFFFNTVLPENAGSPGSGPWILYGGPRPFTGYKESDRPAAATQMCALVANSNHSVQPNSGNCVNLP